MTALATGQPVIHTDTIIFRHGDEVFELPTYGVVGRFAHYDGVSYVAKVTDIRRFLKEQGNG